MEPTDVSARVRQFLDTLGPVVIRDSDRRVPAQDYAQMGGQVVTGSVPREPVPEELLEMVRERMREMANTPPAATPEQKP